MENGETMVRKGFRGDWGRRMKKKKTSDEQGRWREEGKLQRKMERSNGGKVVQRRVGFVCPVLSG